MTLFPLKNFKPSKRLGQNFVHSPLLARNLVNKFELNQIDHVFEVGPGFGILTEAILPLVQTVAVVEKDKRLANYLETKFSNFDKLSIFCDDILGFDFTQLKSHKYKLISNLPYSVATKILRFLLEKYHFFSIFYLSFPINLAKRILNSSDQNNNFLSLYCEIFCVEITKIAFLSRTVFKPQPKIDTCFLRFKLRDHPLIVGSELGAFCEFLKALFKYKRKRLINNLVKFRTKVLDFLQQNNLTINARAEQIPLSKLIELFKLLKL